MERVLRRTAMAKAQAIRRLRRETAKTEKLELRQAKTRVVSLQKLHRQDLGRVRKELEEDYKLGPLAPTRGLDALDREQRDVLTEYSQMNMELPKAQRIKYWNIIPGDRVVLLQGKDRNKVGIVKSLEKETNCLVVEGLNMFPYRVPTYMNPGQGGVPTIMDREVAVPYGSVRLVVPVKDPTTGVLRDAIVKKIGMSTPYFDKSQKRAFWTRYIPFLNEAIPWPRRAKPEEKVDHPGDTKRMLVEEKTYIPTLLRQPFPETVIDELRNKFSKFRDRHEASYVAAMTKKDAEKKKWELTVMATPLKELNRKIRMEKKELGKTQKLTDDILEKIGRAMAAGKPAFSTASTPEQSEIPPPMIPSPEQPTVLS